MAHDALDCRGESQIVQYESLEEFRYELTQEGKDIAASGSHEVKVFNAVPAGETGLPISELAVGFRTAKR